MACVGHSDNPVNSRIGSRDQAATLCAVALLLLALPLGPWGCPGEIRAIEPCDGATRQACTCESGQMGWAGCLPTGRFGACVCDGDAGLPAADLRPDDADVTELDADASQLDADATQPDAGREPDVERPERVTDNLVALYEFDDGVGDEVADSSGVEPLLPLTIQDPDNASWEAGWLTVTDDNILQSDGPATKVYDACQASGAITLEAWIRPRRAVASGPNRIVTMSGGPQAVNVLLGHGAIVPGVGDYYVTRLATTQTSPDGLPSLQTDDGTALVELTHLVMTRSGNGFRWLYLNGERSAADRVRGDFSAWDTGYLLSVANETSGDRPFIGELHLVAIYCDNLTNDEVQRNFAAGAD